MTTTVTMRDAVRGSLLEGLAECYAPDEIAAALKAYGDYQLELDSKEAEYAIVYVETVLGVSLPAPADLDREQFATLGALVDAIMAHLREA